MFLKYANSISKNTHYFIIIPHPATPPPPSPPEPNHHFHHLYQHPHLCHHQLNQQPCIKIRIKLPRLILSQTSKESCSFTVFIVIDYSLMEIVEFVTRNLVVEAVAQKKPFNGFHVAVHLSSNRSQMTSKCRKSKKVAHEAIAECVTDVLTTF